MIVLNNYSKTGTYILLDDNGYLIVPKNGAEFTRQGVAGFSEAGELLGIYIDNNKLFSLYNNYRQEINSSNMICSNVLLDSGKRRFTVEINNNLVCGIIYQPYISPLMLGFGEDEEEFDFLLYLSNILISDDSISGFTRGMKK